MQFPKLYRVRQKINCPVVEDIESTLEAESRRTKILDKVGPGSKVVICAGSRGIPNYPRVLCKLTDLLTARGATVKILPTMGSHGGGHASGQVHVLKELGVTPETVHAPIISTMQVVPIGRTIHGIQVYADKELLDCDHIILVNRIKEHTEFRGAVESGLLKMMAIGLGRYNGAVETHQYAVQLGYEQAIREVAASYLDKLPVLGGIALIDGPDHSTAEIRAILPSEIEDTEPQLLDLARQYTLKLPLDTMDLLIVDQIGKDISGAGMDTKVIGRMMNIYEKELKHPRITRIFVRDLTPATCGNAIGIGLADFTTQRVVSKIDFAVTNLNCITAVTPEKARIPMALPNDEQALAAALETIGPCDATSIKLVWIKNTIALTDLLVSPAAESAIAPGLAVRVAGPFDMEFDQDRNLADPWD